MRPVIPSNPTWGDCWSLLAFPDGCRALMISDVPCCRRRWCTAIQTYAWFVIPPCCNTRRWCCTQGTWKLLSLFLNDQLHHVIIWKRNGYNWKILTARCVSLWLRENGRRHGYTKNVNNLLLHNYHPGSIGGTYKVVDILKNVMRTSIIDVDWIFWCWCVLPFLDRCPDCIWLQRIAWELNWWIKIKSFYLNSYQKVHQNRPPVKSFEQFMWVELNSLYETKWKY